MKILHISTPLSWRGGEQQLVYLVEELKKKNIEQFVLGSENSALEAYCKKNNLNFIAQPKPSSFSLRSAKKISAFCEKENISLIHAHDAQAHSNAVLSAFLFGNKTPVVLSRKVDFPIRKNFLSLYKYNHSSIKKIICVSNAIKDILSPDIRDKYKLTVVYDGIDMNRFSLENTGILRKEFKIQTDELIVGNVAAIAPHKDYFTFVDTAEILIKKNIKAKFFIIGDGPEKEKIKNYIEEKNLDEKIILTDFRKDLEKSFCELDIFLFTSKTEGLGSSILDAYLCGVPVVATTAGGIPEIVTHEQTGLLSPPKNAQSLSENVLKLISNTE